MYSDIDEQVTIERDCEATLIPFGNKITLKKGEEGHITQALGGSYTVMVRGNLVRVEGVDADAIGKIPEVQPWLEETEKDMRGAGNEGRAVSNGWFYSSFARQTGFVDVGNSNLRGRSIRQRDGICRLEQTKRIYAVL